MRIVVKSNFELPGVVQGAFEVQDGTRLRALLELLSQRSRITLIDPSSKKVSMGDFGITVNGKAAQFLPQGLETPLSEDDEVRIAIMPLAGG